MPAGKLPAPGTGLGPCREGCEHDDCEFTRQMAISDCLICGLPIGFDTRFYVRLTAPLPISGLVHALCAEVENEI